MKGSFDPSLLSELLDLAHNPPGADPVLGAFYKAIVEMVESGKLIAKILMEVKRKRPDITHKHLSYLLFRTYQAIKLAENDLSYKNFDQIMHWKKELNKYCAKSGEFKKLLLTKTNSTTIYQRYAGPAAIIAHLYNGTGVAIADLGCGGNYGLRGIELNEPFKTIQDFTPKKFVSRTLKRKLILKKGLAIDKENPDLAEAIVWRMACSFYPQELTEMQTIKEFEERIKLSKKVNFIEVDLLKRQTLSKHKVDVAILSTILYQQTLSNQLILINKAKNLLKNGGIIIVQDFAVKSANPSHLDFSDSWFGKSYSYGTFIAGKKTGWKFWEILRWNNGRCRMVKPGEDFTALPELLWRTPHPD